MKRSKFSIDDQISHMNLDKGIKFNIVDEDSARAFLVKNNYYFKLKSFAKNYEKYATGENKGKYIALEFAYLQDLSTLDMHLRKFIIRASLDLEHFLKVKLLNDVSANEYEDGYQFVKEWLENNPRVLQDISFKKYNNMCSELIQKYEDDFAIWNIVEILSFGDFANLYSSYYNKYPDKKSMHNLIFPVKCVRNAAAHNNCLLNSLRRPYKLRRKTMELSNYVASINGIPKALRHKMMGNPVIHDFVCLLFVFDGIVSSDMIKMHTMMELHELVSKRFLRNAGYYKDSKEISESYRFIKMVIDHFAEKTYN